MTKVLLVTSEAVPLARTGELADICGALPIALSNLGVEVAVAMPAYRCVFDAGLPIEETSHALQVPVGHHIVNGRILKTRLPDSEVPVYLIEQDAFFDRPGLYGEGREDFRDNCERFVFFCRGVMEAIRELQLDVEILHCHDWQTALVPAYLSTEYGIVRGYEHIRTVLTIHNLAYQGRFWHWDMVLTGLDWRYFNWKQLEFFGDLNLLKAGLVFADTLTTVSPRYAQEIQSAPLGCGLEGVLWGRRGDLRGILSGVDDAVWNPETDRHLPRQYSIQDWQSGKATCKEQLQKGLGLSPDTQVPLLGWIGSLVEHKGIELLLDTIKSWVPSQPAQWVVTGSGPPNYEHQLAELAREHPRRVAAVIPLSEELTHQLEAAADMFLMPSRFEPCGLHQLISLKYGTVPIVHRTGGLADTVCDPEGPPVPDVRPNGFVFDRFDANALGRVISRACDIWLRDKATWNQLVTAGMRQDWSWTRSAQRYAELYQGLLARGTQTVGS